MNLDKLHIVICNVFRKEAEAVLNKGGFTDVRLYPVPSKCIKTGYSYGMQLPPLTHIAGNTCNIILSCWLQNRIAGKSGAIQGMRQCHELLADTGLLNYLQFNCNAFVVTPGWLNTWQAYIKNNGFDRETARAFFNESMSCITLLDTGVDSQSGHKLLKFAKFVDLPSNTIEIGTGHLEIVLSNYISQWRLDQLQKQHKVELNNLNKLAGYAFMSSVIKEIAEVSNEKIVIEKSLEFITSIVAPDKLIYIPCSNGSLAKPITKNKVNKGDRALWKAFLYTNDPYIIHPSKAGFLLRLKHGENTVGIIDIDNVSLPQHLNEYLNLSLTFADTTALAIVNSRYYEEIKLDRVLLEKQANTDPLTGILNRCCLFEKLETELQRSKRENIPVSMAVMDIDHFKHINDTYGHAVGDIVLKETVNDVVKQLRKYDMMGRIGGEEFLIVIPGAKYEKAASIFERIRESIENLNIEIENKTIKITASLGFVTTYGESDIKSLIERADEAMYKAKQSGRNRVESGNIRE